MITMNQGKYTLRQANFCARTQNKICSDSNTIEVYFLLMWVIGTTLMLNKSSCSFVFPCLKRLLQHVFSKVLWKYLHYTIEEVSKNVHREIYMGWAFQWCGSLLLTFHQLKHSHVTRTNHKESWEMQYLVEQPLPRDYPKKRENSVIVYGGTWKYSKIRLKNEATREVHLEFSDTQR